MFLLLFHSSEADPYEFMVPLCAIISQKLDFLMSFDKH